MEETNLSKRYRNAFLEVLYIIENFNQENKARVSEKFINFLERNKSQDYVINLPKDAIKHSELLKRETKIILAIMYRDYFCNQEEKDKLDKVFMQNNEKYEAELRKKYNSDNIFKDKNIEKKTRTQENMELIKLEENKKWYKKVFSFIRRIFIK